ncbi:amino acid ABC transporter permease [Uliginosibacterium paludis]|uniref:Amino acid ABC transporter permease n=1 Tax=Uliginosibacterium paludis TaxID=1615952 RepID=A0ABV2CQX4_9RHOO
MIEFSVWDIVRNLALAARWTVGLSLTAFLLGGLMGLAILAARMSHRVWLQRSARGYIEFFQGTPLLMQLFMIFFGIALLGVDVPPWLAAALGLTAFSSAYLAEIWRGCVDAIPKGQWEASASLAMSWFEQMRHVVLPQALRIAVAPTVGFSVQIVKGTAVTSIIGFAELTKTGSMLANATFQPFMVFGFVALGYFILCYPLSLYASYLERKFHGSSAH